MDIKIIYSRRKTMALTVNPEAQVVVKASPRHPKILIDKFVESNLEWINRQLERVKAQQQTKKQFAEGERFLYLGKEYSLHVVDEYRSRIFFDSGFYISHHKLSHAKRLFTEWYRAQALEFFSARAKYFSQMMGVNYHRISVKNTSSRWGSCSSLGNLNFCWRLIMAPTEIADYVVVHELAHLVHKNHSKRFWDMVGEYYPTYKQARVWLNSHGQTLSL